MSQENKAFKALVLSKGNNKSEIARKLGVSSTLIGQYIQGRQKPKWDFFQKWREAYGEDIKQMFETIVSRETIAEDAPVEQYGAILGAKSDFRDKYISLLEESLKEKKDQLKELQARLTDLEGRQRDFLAKVEDSIERYENLVLTQLQNPKQADQAIQDNSPTVLQRTYKKGGIEKQKNI